MMIVIGFTSCTKQEPHREVIITQTKTYPLIKKDLDTDDIDKNRSKGKNIAIVYAIHDIGKYSIEAINTANTYLSAKQKDYNFFVYDIEDETQNNFDTIIQQLHDNDIKDVIFLVTDKKIEYLLRRDIIREFNLYFPLVNIDSIDDRTMIKENMIFGGIDYAVQFEKIFSDAKNKQGIIYEIYDNKPISQILHNKLMKLDAPFESIFLSEDNPNYTLLFKRYKQLNQSIVILNTSIIKSAILLSQLRANDIKPLQIYATQINYTSLIFHLTQAKDREDLKIVNMISDLPKTLSSYYDVSGNDIRYNWVNYSTLIGLEYLFSKKNEIFGNKIINNQVQYDLNFIQVNKTNFTKENETPKGALE